MTIGSKQETAKSKDTSLIRAHAVILWFTSSARCSVRKDILEAKGKGRKLAGKVKGGGRCGERAVCEERGDRKWRVESKKPGGGEG